MTPVAAALIIISANKGEQARAEGYYWDHCGRNGVIEEVIEVVIEDRGGLELMGVACKGFGVLSVGFLRSQSLEEIRRTTIMNIITMIIIGNGSDRPYQRLSPRSDRLRSIPVMHDWLKSRVVRYGVHAADCRRTGGWPWKGASTLS